MPGIEGQHIYDVECERSRSCYDVELSETIAAFIMEPLLQVGHFNATTRLYESCS